MINEISVTGEDHPFVYRGELQEIGIIKIRIVTHAKQPIHLDEVKPVWETRCKL